MSMTARARLKLVNLTVDKEIRWHQEGLTPMAPVFMSVLYNSRW
jgi:hypothetical protein